MSVETTPEKDAPTPMDPKLRPLLVFMWLWVLGPFSYGLYKLFQKMDALFG